MYVIEVWYPAGPGTAFAPGCFDRSLGRTIAVVGAGKKSTSGVLLDYEVEDDGRAVVLRIRIEEEGTDGT